MLIICSGAKAVNDKSPIQSSTKHFANGVKHFIKFYVGSKITYQKKKKNPLEQNTPLCFNSANLF